MMDGMADGYDLIVWEIIKQTCARFERARTHLYAFSEFVHMNTYSRMKYIKNNEWKENSSIFLQYAQSICRYVWMQCTYSTFILFLDYYYGSHYSKHQYSSTCLVIGCSADEKDAILIEMK